MGKKKHKLNTALQAQKKRFHTRDEKKLIADVEESLKERKKNWIKWQPIIFYKKSTIKKSQNKEHEKKENTKNLWIKMFESSIQNYIFDFFDVKNLVSLLLMNSKENLKLKSEEFNKLVEDNRIAENDEKVVSFFSNKDYEKLRSLRTDMYLLWTWFEKIYRNFFIYIITIYENFLEEMMRCILKSYPNMLSKDKYLTYNEFKNYSSIDEIQNFYIESTINDNMEWGALKQIIMMEKLLQNKKYELSKNIPLSSFIEMSTRRNLYVQNEWKINDQYIKKCKEWGIEIEENRIDEELIIDKTYFNKSFYTIVEIVLKISYLVSCKCFNSSDNLTELNEFFNSLIFKLISSNDKEKLWLSTEILKFLFDYTKEDKDHDIKSKSYYLINLALCYKMQWNKWKAKEVLNNEIIYDTTINFKLAIAVINEKWDEAASLMRICSVEDNSEDATKFRRRDYHEFPIFFEFRKTDEFKEEYKKIYWEDFFEEDELQEENELI